MHNINHSERLPYEKLAVLGIDRKKADSLPQEVKEKLASGEVTPLLQVSISARNGGLITLPLKLQLVSDKYGNPTLMAYPVRAVLEKERSPILRLSEQEAERLNKGEVIQKAVEVNGEKVQQYHVKVIGGRLVIHENRKLEKEIRKVSIIEFDEIWFNSKNIVTFDDVITRGITWATYSDQLENLGAHVLSGIFLAKTHYKVTTN